jgi:hypothetical protein
MRAYRMDSVLRLERLNRQRLQQMRRVKISRRKRIAFDPCPGLLRPSGHRISRMKAEHLQLRLAQPFFELNLQPKLGNCQNCVILNVQVPFDLLC